MLGGLIVVSLVLGVAFTYIKPFVDGLVSSALTALNIQPSQQQGFLGQLMSVFFNGLVVLIVLSITGALAGALGIRLFSARS